VTEGVTSCDKRLKSVTKTRKNAIIMRICYNYFAFKHPFYFLEKNMARPRKYDSPDAFNKQVDAFIEQCNEDKLPVTWTGLALYMGFCSRQEIDNYLEYDGFSDSVKRAKMIVENAYEIGLMHAKSAAGPIFALKNFGWSDKQELHHTGDGSAAMTVQIDKGDLQDILDQI
jgi:hypothetical protein